MTPERMAELRSMAAVGANKQAGDIMNPVITRDLAQAIVEILDHLKELDEKKQACGALGAHQYSAWSFYCLVCGHFDTDQGREL